MLDLGLTPLSKSAPMQARAPLGHWCSFCRGVWYSYFLEAQCPRCGNRHG
jgi:Zn finger protein HypA/HybF involved in hydrogenase expression